MNVECNVGTAAGALAAARLTTDRVTGPGPGSAIPPGAPPVAPLTTAASANVVELIAVKVSSPSDLLKLAAFGLLICLLRLGVKASWENHRGCICAY